MYLGGWFKIIGFFINIMASLMLINGALFRWSGGVSIVKFLLGKMSVSRLNYLRIHWNREWAPSYTTKDVIITSILVIVGSSLQMSGDLIDP